MRMRQVCMVMKREEEATKRCHFQVTRKGEEEEEEEGAYHTSLCVLGVFVLSLWSPAHTEAVNMNTKRRRRDEKEEKRRGDTVNSGVSYHIYNVNASDTVCYCNSTCSAASLMQEHLINAHTNLAQHFS